MGQYPNLDLAFGREIISTKGPALEDDSPGIDEFCDYVDYVEGRKFDDWEQCKEFRKTHTYPIDKVNDFYDNNDGFLVVPTTHISSYDYGRSVIKPPHLPTGEEIEAFDAWVKRWLPDWELGPLEWHLALAFG